MVWQLPAFYSCVPLHRVGRAVSYNAHYVAAAGYVVHLFGYLVYYRYIVSFVIELLYKRLSDLAAAYDDYVHCVLLFQRLSPLFILYHYLYNIHLFAGKVNAENLKFVEYIAS